MAEESNGLNSTSRMDRIERAIEALIDGHDRLFVSHKDLLRAQVIMYDNMTSMGATMTSMGATMTSMAATMTSMAATMTSMAATVNTLSEKVASHEDSIQALIDSQLR